MKRLKELRFSDDAQLDIEAREDSPPLLRGYASVFNKWSKGLPWKERVLPGSFSKSISEGDIRALWNHDTNFPLGRNKAGTLRLEEDKRGLRVEIDPPDTQAGRDAVESVRRGDVSGMSIGFEVIKDEWDQKKNERSIQEIKLFEVSPVTFPAFPQTSVKVRSFVPDFEPDIDIEYLTGLMFRRSRGEPITMEESTFLLSAMETMAGFIPDMDDEVDSTEHREEPTASHSDERTEPTVRPVTRSIMDRMRIAHLSQNQLDEDLL